MNKEWSVLNKKMQLLLRKKDTFKDGISVCLELRNKLSDAVEKLCDKLNDEQYSLMPYPDANGYHCKTIAYSIWHTARIEDITTHTLICGDEQVLFRDEITAFSQSLNIAGLLRYAADVKASTDKLLSRLSYEDSKRRFTSDDKERVIASKSVSEDENAVWLIDYWCSKDIAGIIKMPFTRHLIMHIEAMMRIAGKIGIEI